MKRKSIIFAVFLVNIALLANILIPHHHHEDEVCFISMHCEADCDTHHQDDADHQHDAAHKHDTKGAEDHHDCLLDIEVIVPSTHDYTQKIAFTIIEDQSEIDGFTALEISLEAQKHPPSGLLAFSPLILQHYSCIVSHSQGLRAPPSC